MIPTHLEISKGSGELQNEMERLLKLTTGVRKNYPIRISRSPAKRRLSSLETIEAVPSKL